MQEERRKEGGLDSFVGLHTLYGGGGGKNGRVHFRMKYFGDPSEGGYCGQELLSGKKWTMYPTACGSSTARDAETEM